MLFGVTKIEDCQRRTSYLLHFWLQSFINFPPTIFFFTHSIIDNKMWFRLVMQTWCIQTQLWVYISVVCSLPLPIGSMQMSLVDILVKVLILKTVLGFHESSCTAKWLCRLSSDPSFSYFFPTVQVFLLFCVCTPQIFVRNIKMMQISELHKLFPWISQHREFCHHFLHNISKAAKLKKSLQILKCLKFQCR